MQYIGEEKHDPATLQTKLLSNASAYLWINHFSGQKNILLKGLMAVSVSELEADSYERATAVTAQAGKPESFCAYSSIQDTGILVTYFGCLYFCLIAWSWQWDASRHALCTSVRQGAISLNEYPVNAASVSGWSDEKTQCYSIVAGSHLEDGFPTEAETLFTTSELTPDSLSMTKIQLYCAISFTPGLPWCHEV